MMTININPDDDLAVVDGTETVTLRRRGSSQQTVVAGALRRAVGVREGRVRNRYNTWKEPPSDGRHTASDAVWHLPASVLPDAPRLGDLIVDAAGQRWTILSAQLGTLRSRWECGVRNLAIVYGLDDTVTILKATYAKGVCGSAEPTWHPWKTGVRARIQPAEATVDTEHEARRTTRRFQVFLEEDVPLDHNHCLQGPDGTIYRIRGSSGTERIDELQTIKAEVSPSGAAPR